MNRSNLAVWEEANEHGSGIGLTHAAIVGYDRTICNRTTEGLIPWRSDLDAMTSVPTCADCLSKVRRAVSRLLNAALEQADD